MIQFKLIEIGKFKKDHSQIAYSKLFPEIQPLLDRTNIIIDLINEIRLKQKNDDEVAEEIKETIEAKVSPLETSSKKHTKNRTRRRPTNYKKYREYRNELVIISRQLDDYRTQLIEHIRRENFKSAFKLVVTASSIIGIVLVVARMMFSG